ncbi:MAG: HRDC domain-containing protein [Chthoniobacter sp.]|uniref:ribonuclease D n=1 Tax=Chthoniobacter sp. TaxID=2510640 RepID=UPI0032ACC7D7
MQPLIDTADALHAVLPLFAPHSRIPIDTEADSLHCYFEKLCLIQISVPDQDLLIDPLAEFSLQPLFDSLAGKELIIHGADYDLRLLRRVGFVVTAPVFDTMIAARLCGIEEFSLAALIKRYFDVQLTKGSQKANWARRPLSPQMADYAVKDTHYLLEIASILETELTRLDRVEWFRQSCGKAVASSAIIKERDPEEVWRITGSKDLKDRASAILRALWHWREEEAKAIDRPTFHILHSEQLVDAAGRFDREQEVDFPQLHGARRRRFYEAVEQAKALPEDQWPKIIRKPRPRPTRGEEERFKSFKVKRDTAATELKLDPSLIAPKSMLENLAANPEETAARMLPWQRATLGV